MSLSWPSKDPDEELEYDLDWTKRLWSKSEIDQYAALIAATPSLASAPPSSVVMPSDTISGSTWLIVTGTVAKQSDSRTTIGTRIWLTGGTLLEKCLLTNRITTVGLRTMDQSVKLSIKAK